MPVTNFPFPALAQRALLTAAIFFTGCSESADRVSPELSLRQKIAQKLMLDVRYYCSDEQRQTPDDGAAPRCETPVTVLPDDLRKMISESDVGGIILFADNLADSAQMVRLNRDLRRAALESKSGLPLLVGVDQEGGRVNRLPRDEAAAFAGNMAIGATYTRRGDHFARETAGAMAEQLKALGFNVNFAPTLDVNSNPENPVINVRSYGESPQMVAELGAASVEAFQQKGIAATVKHFPGHGDTSVDSHTGLPRVARARDAAWAVDLLPFSRVIERAQPALIMTAHIQYPALDDTILQARSGEEILVPATLSRKILSGILRGEMGYEGVIVTDALDMAGISHYFTPEQAVVHTFAAGADIALMPVKIRYPEDLAKVDTLIDAVAAAVADGSLDVDELESSVARILQLKQRVTDPLWLQQGEKEAVHAAQSVLASPAHRELASQLASAALTSVFTPVDSALPVIHKNTRRVQVLSPNSAIGEAFRIALAAVTGADIEILETDSALDAIVASPADALIVASVVPSESAVEMGGAEDLAKMPYRRPDQKALYDIYRQSLVAARAQGSKTVFVSMRSPYESADFHGLADVYLASFDYKGFIGPGRKLQGPIYHALARALVSGTVPGGDLPVTVRAPALSTAPVTDVVSVLESDPVPGTVPASTPIDRPAPAAAQ
ncbi:glycoside hydrolase family 3 protein [Microbulbifer bruguierae]|uniref:beta-N-acetylhexosaminidase n=1 Tax=Microbulbifer bruguierae TaxID=3029061 RepID=A0ABY8NC76_9GAMM|nr:glycoside hydrolase family 3 protein [Microbulbifer bruguierae]WGL16300.1 glycoside hydrolase family 3 protein [Microbulbifer bruguierae]